MAREVYAEEIEEFLERLEGVASARVVANDEGVIERIFLTTESGRDDAALRRQVGAALMSEYGLHLEGWRLHVAHLRPEPGRAPPARFRLFRIEETLTESSTRVLVDLRYERDGAQKQAVGVAQASPGAAFRLRTVALATLQAMAKALADLGWEAALETVSILPFAGVQVALVGVTLAPPPQAAPDTPQVRVGAEVVRQSETEAVVRATFRALGQLSEEEAPRPRDRQDRIEALRAHYHHLIRLPQAPVAPAEGGAPAPASVPAPASGPPVAGPPPVAVESPPAVGEAAPAVPPLAPETPDVISGVGEIRPEVEGGAEMSTRGDPLRGEAARAVGRGGLEDEFYRRLIATGAVVHIRCRDGYEIPEAVVKDFGTYSLLLEARGVEELIFKHAIISIRPRHALPFEVPVQA